MPVLVTVLLALHKLTNIPIFPDFNNLFLTAIAVEASWGLIAGLIGAPKGRENVGVTLGFLLGAMGVLMTLVMRGDRKECASCCSFIRREATVCAFCTEPQLDPIP